MTNIQTLCKRLRIVFQLLFVFFCTVPFVVLFAPHTSQSLADQNFWFTAIQLSGNLHYEMTVIKRVMCFAIGLIPTGFTLFVLYYLINLFKSYEHNQIFTQTNVRYFRNISYLLIFSQLTTPIVDVLTSLALTYDNPPGQHMISISFTGTNIGILLMAFVTLLISYVMLEGAKMRDENLQFV